VAVQIGLILGMVGSLLVAYGALRVLRQGKEYHRSFDRALERGVILTGFLMIAVGFGVRLLVEAGRLFR
jgi:uncharacterized membrane protein YidH (DUF202 family)